MPEAQPGQEQRMDTDEQCKRFGCDLIDLLRREGRWSGVWFGDRLLQAADELEKATRPTADLGDDGELVRRLRAPAYWMSGSSDGHEGENYAPLEAADRLILYREALEAITREDGKNSRGFIDWQRCVDRIQAVARAVLSSDRKVAGDSGSA